MPRISADLADLLFRALFCSIFVGLGLEHVFSDTLIQHLMPAWVPFKRAVSMACGFWLILWGTCILVGWRIQLAAKGLALFLVLVTLAVHLPAVFIPAPELPAEYHWMWDILQRSNLVKNMCLLGVCFHLQHHQPGRYSLQSYLSQRKHAPLAS